MAHLDPEIVLLGWIKEKARKDIAESTEFLEASEANLLIPCVIWTRLLRSLDGFKDFDKRLFELEGRETTAIIAFGQPKACALYFLISEYAKEATTRNSSILHIQLANNGMLRVAALAREAVTWHFGFEDVVHVALDISSLVRSSHIGMRQPRDLPELQLYTGRRYYKPTEKIELLEC